MSICDMRGGKRERAIGMMWATGSTNRAKDLDNDGKKDGAAGQK